MSCFVFRSCFQGLSSQGGEKLELVRSLWCSGGPEHTRLGCAIL